MPDLRPMNFGEILDGSLVIYRRHFGLFLKLAAAILALPAALLVYFGFRLVAGLPQDPVRALLPLLPVVVVYYVASLALAAGTIRVIADSYLGRDPRLQDALALGMSKIWPLVVVGLGKGVVLLLIVAGIGIVAAIAIPLARSAGALGSLLAAALLCTGVWFAIYVQCGYGVTTPVVVLEDLRSSFDAFGRSWQLTRKFKLKVLGLAVVAFLLTNLIPSVVLRGLGAGLVKAVPPAGVALTALGFVAPLVLAPVLAAVITLMYYDLRVRREAFDLQVLGQELGIV